MLILRGLCTQGEHILGSAEGSGSPKDCLGTPPAASTALHAEPALPAAPTEPGVTAEAAAGAVPAEAAEHAEVPLHAEPALHAVSAGAVLATGVPAAPVPLAAAEGDFLESMREQCTCPITLVSYKPGGDSLCVSVMRIYM